MIGLFAIALSALRYHFEHARDVTLTVSKGRCEVRDAVPLERLVKALIAHPI
jgi:hypothetical protein